MKKSMKSLIFIALAASLLLAACVPNIVLRPNTPDIVVNVPQGSTPAITGPTLGADNHFIQADDFFVMEDPLGSNTWVYTAMAKMSTAPSSETDNQAQFLRIMDGQSLWSRHWAYTRKATAEDIALGKQVIFLDVTNDDDVYRSPESNQEARTSWWLTSRIVDLTNLFRGQVMVGGGLNVRTDALRVIVE